MSAAASAARRLSARQCVRQSGALPSTANCRARTHRRCSAARRRSNNDAVAQGGPNARRPRQRGSPWPRPRSGRGRSAVLTLAVLRGEIAVNRRHSPGSRPRARGNKPNTSGNRALRWLRSRLSSPQKDASLQSRKLTRAAEREAGEQLVDGETWLVADVGCSRREGGRLCVTHLTLWAWSLGLHSRNASKPRRGSDLRRRCGSRELRPPQSHVSARTAVSSARRRISSCNLRNDH